MPKVEQKIQNPVIQIEEIGLEKIIQHLEILIESLKRIEVMRVEISRAKILAAGLKADFDDCMKDLVRSKKGNRKKRN